MATWDDVGRISLALPQAREQPSRAGRGWRVGTKSFVWERPLRRAEITALGAEATDGPVLAAYVPDAGVKDLLVGDDPGVFFTTPHFDGYPIVLVRLDRIVVPELEEIVVEAWLARAPKRLVKAYLADQG